jgi:hypothetical protein
MQVVNMSGMQLCLMVDFNVLKKLNIKSIGRQVRPLFARAHFCAICHIDF